MTSLPRTSAHPSPQPDGRFSASGAPSASAVKQNSASATAPCTRVTAERGLPPSQTASIPLPTAESTMARSVRSERTSTCGRAACTTPWRRRLRKTSTARTSRTLAITSLPTRADWMGSQWRWIPCCSLPVQGCTGCILLVQAHLCRCCSGARLATSARR